jgi:geranylgeranyl diphosphate synthase, type I
MDYTLESGVDPLREAIDNSLSQFVDRENAYLRSIGNELHPVADALKRFLVDSGKRFRPLFAAAGFVGSGGILDTPSINAISSIELVHVCALIHDDVMDASDTRRGAPAIHKLFETIHRENSLKGSPQQFGVASAILLGDLALVWASKALHESGMSSDSLLRAFPLYDEMRVELMAGQYLDVYEQALASESIERSLRVARFKSGKYSIERPLHFGAALAAGSNMEAYSGYGIPLGEAFQLRDDLLGVFGNPAQTGKPAGDDLREGKRTVLIAATMERSSAPEKTRINSLLGKPDLSPAEVEEVRSIITSTGAADFVETMITDLTAQALESLQSPTITSDAKKFLLQMADVATKRSY